MTLLKLPSSYTIPGTSAPLPDAVLDVIDGQVNYRAGQARFQVAVFASAAAEAAGMQPVWEGTRDLTAAEIQALRSQFTGALLTTLSQRAEFAGSTVI